MEQVKKNKILALCIKNQEERAKQAGADYVGLKEYVEKIKNGWFDFNTIVTTPEIMPELKKIGKILGPKGLMPNTKTETITTNLYDSIKKIKKGRIVFKTDKYGIIHSSIGKISFSNKKIKENAEELLNAIIKSKPLFLKNTYLKNIVLSSTMSKSVIINKRNYII